MKLGTLEGARENISKLHSILSAIGQSGTVEIRNGDGGWRTVPVSDSFALKVPVPFPFDYRIEGGAVVIHFRRPFPYATYLINHNIENVTVTLTRIEIGISMAPDGYLEVVS